MNTTTRYRYQLDKSSKKFQCPQCGQKRFVRTVDIETGQYLPDHVGRCDRQNACSYEFNWKQFLAENKREDLQAICAAPPAEEQPIDFLNPSYLEACAARRHFDNNNFSQFMKSIFGEAVAWRLVSEYCLGTSNHWRGACVFPQLDEMGRLRQIKIMLHDPVTGKRVKAGAQVQRFDRNTKQYISEIAERPCALLYGRYIDESTRQLNLKQTFFGHHLLAENPDKPVAVVESEKTAIIASVYIPGCIWLATGGASGCTWREYSVYKALAGRSVTFFPDHGYYNLKRDHSCYYEWRGRAERIQEALPTAKIRVSDLLEQRLSSELRQDQDIADLLLQRDKQTGMALTDAGYPVIWDFPPMF